MLTDQYDETVTLMGAEVTLAQLDIGLRCATLAVCLLTLVLNVVRLRRGK